MGNYAVIGNAARLFGVALVGLTAIALLSGGDALADSVGVTSAADGDPLGKPPNENERVLRIGIDVQANELITTSANDRAHLVFLDGSSLTVGPDARLTIDRFVFDPNTQKGDLAVNATRGVFRLVGGKISKNSPIVITTPSNTIGIRGGITILSVTQVQTIAGFVFGHSMTVTAGGQTQTATRAGSEVITKAGGVPGAVTLFKRGGLTAALSQLEGTSSNNNNSADQSAQSSGFSSKNSGQPPINTPNFNQNGPPNTNNNTLTNAVSFSNPASQPVGNSTLQNQNVTNTVLTTNTDSTTNTVSTTNPNNNPTPPSGPTSSSQTLTGFAGGLVVIDQPGGNDNLNSRRVLLLSQPGSISITTDAANNQAKGTLVVGANGSQQFGTATLQLSGTGNSTFIAMANDPSRPSTFQIGGSTYQFNANTALVSLSNPSACTCEFLNWGVWASSALDPRNNGTIYTAVGTYVAGTPTVQLPMTGSATYNGFMAGFAQGGGNAAPYFASGSYQNVWNFQSRTGAFNGSFDGRSYSGMTATGGAGSTTFAGNFSGGSRSGSLNGAFFASPSDAAKYQAGSFSIGSNGSGYQASGIFAGQR
jgi:FecR protein